MNKREFLSQLEEALLRLSKSDRDDILLDYEEHFRAGSDNGMTEEEVAEKLGKPSEIAAQYLENLPADAKGAPAREEEPEEESGFKSEEKAEPVFTPSAPAPAAQNEPTSGQKVANVFFWIGIVIVSIWIIQMLIGLVAATVGCFTGAVVLTGIAVFMASASISLLIGFILIAVGLICMGVLFIIAFKYLLIGFKKLIAVCKSTSNKILGRE